MKIHVGVIFLVLLSLCSAASNIATSTNSYLTDAHRNQLFKVIEGGLSLSDVGSLYYAVVGSKYLNRAIPNAAGICDFLIKSANKENENGDLESIFHLVSTWQSVGSCKSLPTGKLVKTLKASIEKETLAAVDYYHAVSAYVALGQKLEASTVSKLAKTLDASLKKDESLTNLGYIFHTASILGPAGEFALKKIEDTIIQADEVDGKMLQFEGGLSVTSLLVTGIEKLSTSLKKPPPVSAQQIVKLSNYFLSRLTVQQPRGVVNLLSALTMLATNQVSRPVTITRADNGLVISSKQPFVIVKVCDILGNPLVAVPTVVANSVTRLADDVVVVSKQNLKPSPTDKTLFKMNLNEIKPQRGFYQVSVSAGGASNTIKVKVITEVKVDYLEMGIGDADQTTQPKLVRINYPSKMSSKVEADSQQKLVMRFMLRDVLDNKPMRVHQAFVRLSAVDETTKQLREVVYVAEPDSSDVYKFEMQVGSAARVFNYESGEYKINVIVGDGFLSNSLEWYLGDVSLKFPDKSTTDAAPIEKSTAAPGYKQKPTSFLPKPEIKHMFREPEKRPSVFVSNLFTGLCLAPALLLLILWIKLDVNVSKFPFSISAIVFHLGLGSIFVLFGIFWLKLGMFVTLRYLFGLCVVTFLAGSKLLSHINQSQKLSRC